MENYALRNIGQLNEGDDPMTYTPDIEQIREYIEQNKPISIDCMRRWLEYLLSEVTVKDVEIERLNTFLNQNQFRGG